MLHSPSRRHDPFDPLRVHLPTCLTRQGGDAPRILLADDLTRRLEATLAPLRTFMLELAWQWTGEARDRLPRRPPSCPRPYERKSLVWGKGVSVRVDTGVRLE